jgi:peptidoglycan/LPS O-acetylase OafA/YrhL
MIHMVVLTAMLLAIRIGLKAPMVDGRLQISGLLGTACLGAALPIVLYISGLTHRWIEQPGRQLGRRLADRLNPPPDHQPAAHTAVGTALSTTGKRAA